jgi:hypothetical protein
MVRALLNIAEDFKPDPAYALTATTCVRLRPATFPILCRAVPPSAP